MHPNAARIHELYDALHAHNPDRMRSCYHPDATFRDIAFDLKGAGKIHDMWRMICRKETDIKVTPGRIVEADDRAGRARVVETYRYGATKDPRKPGRPVTNDILSSFTFENGRITSQIDECDPKAWAEQAMKWRIFAFLAGRIRLVRSLAAKWKLWKFRRKPG